MYNDETKTITIEQQVMHSVMHPNGVQPWAPVASPVSDATTTEVLLPPHVDGATHHHVADVDTAFASYNGDSHSGEAFALLHVDEAGHDHTADADPVCGLSQCRQRDPAFHARAVDVADQRVEVVEVPCRFVHVALVGQCPDVEHFLPGAVLWSGFDPVAHG